MWALPCALGAAASFGVANVVQMRAARRTGAGDGIDARLLLRLATDRSWLLGLATSTLGYALQALALFLAPVVLVQPLIVTELLFALPLAAILAGGRLRRREWTAASLVAGGLAAFMLVAQPSGMRTEVPPAAWATMTVAVGLFVAAFTSFAEVNRHRPMLRAAALAAAASMCFGLMSILTKTVTRQFGQDHAKMLAHPEPWLLAIVALTGLLLGQTAFRIAPLSVSLPVIDVGEPVTGSLLAIIVFGEKLATGPLVVAGVVAAAVVVIAGIALLDTSPLVRATQQELGTAAAQREPAGPVPEIACAAAGPGVGGNGGRAPLRAWQGRHFRGRHRGIS
jgi:drug/metabolite transporter (DMT)-like permease